MRPLLTGILLFLIYSNSLTGEKYRVINTGKQMQYRIQFRGSEYSAISDANGKLLVQDNMISGMKLTEIPNDSLVNFPGYPFTLPSSNGWMIEGSIFSNMDSDADMEIVTLISGVVYAYNHNGTSVPGWPVFLERSTHGAPAFGDIDGDGEGEVIVNDRDMENPGQGKIYAFSRNGQIKPGFPIEHGFAIGTPVLADLDNDGALEIFTNKTYNNEIYVYKGNGSRYPGWPKDILTPCSSASVGDVTGDGIPEVFMEGYDYLCGWDKNGNLLPGFPYFLSENEKCSYSSPVLADLDNDGKREIIFGTHRIETVPLCGWVHVVRSNGTSYPNWPVKTENWIYAPVSVGFIDDDNILDIAVGDWAISFIPNCHVYAWNSNAETLKGFETDPPQFGINAQIMMTDLDSDNKLDLIADDNVSYSNGEGRYHAYKNDGSVLPGWPVITNGSTFYKPLCITDINIDGILDLSGASQRSGSTNLYLWNTGVNYNPSLVKLPVFQYNERHNGIWDDITVIGITSISHEIPSSFVLEQNYPNPFNPVTKIKFQIPNSSHVRIAVFDILGREIDVLVDKALTPGTYSADWNAFSFSSGVYFYKIITSEFSETKKMVLTK